MMMRPPLCMCFSGDRYTRELGKNVLNNIKASGV
jgi:hypothetical protein